MGEEPRTFGPNDWLVEEMYEQFKADPISVSENWREFFADNFRPNVQTRATFRQPRDRAAIQHTWQHDEVADYTKPLPLRTSHALDEHGAELIPLRGSAKRIAENMDASLAIPTATSVRAMPARLMEVNREIINGHLRRTRRGKISYTHIIGFAVLEALRAVPNMASSIVERDGEYFVHKPHSVGLGLAVDVARKDGSRSLLVPCIKNADAYDFKGFWIAYDEMIRKVKLNKIAPEDFTGVSLTLTNPGTIGTEHSIPRLMKGQGVIVGVGAIGYPAQYESADPRALAQLGMSKVFNVTSTYDHRVIQGAESGLFLAQLHALLTGEHDFYRHIFRSLGIPYEPARLTPDDNPPDIGQTQMHKQMQVWNLMNMYRVRGHLIADLDPLDLHEPRLHSELDPITYGLSIWDNEREFYTGGLAGKTHAKLGEILSILRDAYCRQMGVEYMYIQNPEEKQWIQDHVEGVPRGIDQDEQRWILSRLNAAEAFEKFLAARYVGQKRFGLEGAESAIPILDTVLDSAAQDGIVQAVMGMTHRGRLNVLINILGKSYYELFNEFEGNLDPTMSLGSGDVKYHKGYTTEYIARSGHAIDLTLAANPSHLEAVDPVVEGMARAKQDVLDWTNDASDSSIAFPVLPILVHGDAAFAGQGVVAETLNLSLLPGYRTGGTIHLVIDNQLGFTTNPASARSSAYATDVAKMVQAPVFHCNGDDPESCVRVAKLAYAFRERFAKDVVIRLVCYRRFGHNEGDEPSFTQPTMYERIQNRRSVRKLYTEMLIARGDITLEEAEAALDEFSDHLQSALDETRSSALPLATTLPKPREVDEEVSIATGVDHALLDRIMHDTQVIPDSFAVHPKLAKLLAQRRASFDQGSVDWATGELLAFGSLLLEGHDVRLAGQDSRRGTFSHRHGVLMDHKTEEEYCPLVHLGQSSKGAGRFFIYDSLLSEYAALGFEYGYSLVRPDALVVWEAQFGDFANGAQIVIDQFISSSKDKWSQASNLVLMLPHGYEGQGPEHSSARLERFLTLAANDNMRVVNVTTAAQHFHVLRRQVLSGEREPLIIMSPKYLLRAPSSRSPVSDFSSGRFEHVLDDVTRVDPGAVERIVVCSGKIAFEAMERRDEIGSPTAIVRLEQFYPWPAHCLDNVLRRYTQAREVVWLQEEPLNMGGAKFVALRLPEMLREGVSFRQVGRYPSGSPSTGSYAMHTLETEDVLSRTFQAGL